jgi:hypothetical protein
MWRLRFEFVIYAICSPGGLNSVLRGVVSIILLFYFTGCFFLPSLVLYSLVFFFFRLLDYVGFLCLLKL